MVVWHHWLDGHEFEQAPGVGDGQEAWSAVVHGVTNSRQDWATELNWTWKIPLMTLLQSKTREVQSKQVILTCSESELSYLSNGSKTF